MSLELPPPTKVAFIKGLRRYKFLKAFTLAEVLITLGIIGVVAAMTLPAIIGHYKKQEIASKLKKFSSTIQNAFTMASAQYGDMSGTIQTNKMMQNKQMNL